VHNPACVSCCFYLSGSTSAFGRCLHPDHQHPGVPITIRAQELNCYRGIGRSDWTPARIGDHAHFEDIVISERPAPIRPVWRILRPLDEPEVPAFGLSD
jgi:hypothetical protein